MSTTRDENEGRGGDDKTPAALAGCRWRTPPYFKATALLAVPPRSLVTVMPFGAADRAKVPA